MCARCGGALSARSTGRLCPACLLRATMSDDDLAPPPPVECEGYTLLEEIGRGGMGSVWQGIHDKTGDTVAIKFLVSGALATDDDRRRFIREAKITRSLDHPGIVRVRELGETNDHLFLVMDFVEGETLAQRLRRGPVPSRQSAEWLRALAKAVEQAHAQNIIHRDLKPGNILLDSHNRPHVADFGLAAIIDRPGESSLSSSGLGTIPYLAPEQAAGRRDLIGPATDMHGLGAVLFHCLTGRPPFLGETVASALRAVMDHEVPAPRTLNPAVPIDLETICLKCLRNEPSARYPSAQELAADLERFLRGEPIVARPLNALQRLWQWSRRRPLAATLVVVSILAFVIVAALAWQTSQKAGLSHELNRTLAASASGRADSLFRLDETAEAVGELVRQIQKDTNDVWAVSRVLSAMTWRNWPLPIRAFGPDTNRAFFGAFSADGRRVVTADQRGTINIWDTGNGLALCEQIKTDDAHFQMFRENGWIVQLSPGGRLKAIRVEDGKTLLQQLPTTAISLALNSKEPIIAVIVADQIEIWNFETGKRLREFPSDGFGISDTTSSRQLPAAAFSADGLRLVTAKEHTSAIWECESGRRTTTLTNNVRAPNAVRFTSDGNGLILAGSSEVALLNIASQREVWRLAPVGGISRTEWTSRSNQIVIVHGDPPYRLSVLDGQTGRELGTSKSKHTFDGDNPFSLDASRLLISRGNSAIAIHSATDVKRISEHLHATYIIANAEFSPDGHQVILCDYSSHVYLYDVRPGAATPSRIGGGPAVVSYQISQSGDAVLAGVPGKARLWNTHSLKPLGPELRQSNPIECVALSPDGRRAATCTKKGEVMLWNPTNGASMAGPWNHDGEPLQMTFSPDGKILAVALSNLKLWVHDVTTDIPSEFPLLFNEREYQANRIDVIRFDRSGTRLLIASDRGVAVFDVPGRRRLWSSEASSFDAAFSPDGRRVALNDSRSNQAFISDAATGKRLIGPLEHPDFVVGVAFDPGCEFLFTTCMESIVRVWNVANGSLVRTLSGHANGVRSVRFSRDGRRMTTASLDNTIRLWDAELGLPLSEFMGGHGGSNVSFADFADDDRRLLVFSAWPETPDFENRLGD